MMPFLTLLLRIFGAIYRQRTYFVFVLLYTMSHYHNATGMLKWKINGHMSIEVEFGSFSPLVFSTAGIRIRPYCHTIVIKRLASMIADKQEQPYSKTLFFVVNSASLSYDLLSCAFMVPALHTTGHTFCTIH